MTVAQVQMDLRAIGAKGVEEAARLYFQPLTFTWGWCKRLTLAKVVSFFRKVFAWIAVTLLLLLAGFIIIGLFGWAANFLGRKVDTLPMEDFMGAGLIAIAACLGGASIYSWRKKRPARWAVGWGASALALTILAVHVSVHPLQAFVVAAAGGAGALGLASRGGKG